MFFGHMKTEPSRDDSSLTEKMVARFEIEDLEDPVRENEVTVAVAALDGVIETSITNGALHVTYNPLLTRNKKIEEAVSAAGGHIKCTDGDTETPHP